MAPHVHPQSLSRRLLFKAAALAAAVATFASPAIVRAQQATPAKEPEGFHWLEFFLGSGLIATLLAIYRVFTGYHIINLSIDLVLSRTPSATPAEHDLVVTIGLTKGKSASLTIEDLRVVARWGESTVRPVKIDTDLDNLQRHLNLAPEEKAQFGCHFVVPATAVCHVETRLRGKTLRPNIFGLKMGSAKESGWRASAISVPPPPPATSCGRGFNERPSEARE